MICVLSRGQGPADKSELLQICYLKHWGFAQKEEVWGDTGLYKSINYYEAANWNHLKIEVKSNTHWDTFSVVLSSVVTLQCLGFRAEYLTSWTVALVFRGLSSSRKFRGYNTYVWLQPVASVVMLIQKQTWQTAVVYDVASPGGRATATSQPDPESTDL